MALLSVLFISCNKETLNLETNGEPSVVIEGSVSKPLHFGSVQDLTSAIYNGDQKLSTKAANDDFVSYAETIMAEDGYDDLPNAIYSTAFGSVLNADGEVEFGDYMLKVTEYGLLFAPVANKLEVDLLAQSDDLLSLCTDKTICQAINDEKELYKIDGYSDVFFYDTFGFKSGSQQPATKALDIQLNAQNKNAYSLGLAANWNNTFTVPPAGQQKWMFSDGKYCNDTKIYQQDYLVASARGLKTKTMKKGFLGIWSQVNNDLFACMDLVVLDEQATFAGVNRDINTVNYAGKEYVIYTVSARGMNPQTIMLKTNDQILSAINEGVNYAQTNGVNVVVSGVRYILDDQHAVTRFPNFRSSGDFSCIEMDWIVPFGGQTTCSASLLTGSGDMAYLGQYYVLGCTISGRSTRGNEIRGSVMVYTHDPVDE